MPPLSSSAHTEASLGILSRLARQQLFGHPPHSRLLLCHLGCGQGIAAKPRIKMRSRELPWTSVEPIAMTLFAFAQLTTDIYSEGKRFFIADTDFSWSLNQFQVRRRIFGNLNRNASLQIQLLPSMRARLVVSVGALLKGLREQHCRPCEGRACSLY